MLILARKTGQSIMIDGEIELTITRISGNRVTVGIRAPEQTRILRGELTPFTTDRDRPGEEAA